MPSSLAALLHGTLTAVGMWPPRCDCSCGRCAGASSRPANSSGLRTSTRPLVPIACDDLVAEGADAQVGLGRGVAGRRPGHGLAAQLAGVELPLLAAAVEQQDVLVAVQLEVPVRVGGEPVVVAAVEHDGVVVADAPLGEQLLELLPVDEVAADRVLQVGLPVQLDRPGDVAAVVRAGVLVDLDQDDVVVGPCSSTQSASTRTCCLLMGFLSVKDAGQAAGTKAPSQRER